MQFLFNSLNEIGIVIISGVEDGQTVRMQVGQKEVFITFRVEKSDYFRREGPDIHTDAFISLSQAALGGAIRLQGIYEDLTVDIPKGTPSHTRIRLNGKGLRKVNAYGFGDHYIHVLLLFVFIPIVLLTFFCLLTT